MSLGRTFTVTLLGVKGHIVEVEADIGQSLPGFHLLGLPDASLQEAKERIRSAARNAGMPLKRRKITVNLLPTALPKSGSSFDLSIVMAALSAAGDIQPPGKTVFLAELGLDSRLRPIRGILPAVFAAVRCGYRSIIVASANHAEAQLVPGAEVRSYSALGGILRDFGADAAKLVADLPPVACEPQEQLGAAEAPDLRDLIGQEEARFALEVAAVGRHHLLLVGPPGAGKTMLAERLPGILPDLDPEEAMETTAIRSLHHLGFLPNGLVMRPPFENPHHTASLVSIIGGGTRVPRPGAASRAHNGVLFLDEAPEYDKRTLEALREPLESGELVLHRAAGSATFPARFQLLLAANPCSCGRLTLQGKDCTCTATARRRYMKKLSGPLLDRVDLQLTVERITHLRLASEQCTETTATVARRVANGRNRSRFRLRKYGLKANSDIPGSLLRSALCPSEASRRSIDRSLQRGDLTARGYDRVLRIAWSLADLEDASQPNADHIGRALLLRNIGSCT